VDSGVTRSDADGRQDWFQRGTNQSGMRDANERLVLSLVRRHGSLSKTDIARMTSLSAQTVSVIMRELEAERLLLRGTPVRGKVGQPSVPLSLNPDGALFLGLKIGRRSANLVLIDFLGQVRATESRSYSYPTPSETIEFVRAGIAHFRAGLTPEQDKRIAGLGIAMPFELWNWADTVGAPRAVMDQWRGADIRADIALHCPFPVYLQNDATAACGAELVFGDTTDLRDFLYFYVGSFIGGGIVLNGALYTGRTGNAGALGSMPVPGAGGRPIQLIDIASIAVLEQAIARSGRDATFLWTSPEDWGDTGPQLGPWIESAAHGIAYAIVAAASVVDFEAVVIEGWMPRRVRDAVIGAVGEALKGFDSEGIRLPELRAGTIGIHARAIGGASLPLFDRFLTQAGLTKDHP
jgi:predicted NBD/HSP70 family sugar kinase